MILLPFSLLIFNAIDIFINMKQLIYFTLLIVMTICSCGQREQITLLKQADMLMEEHPDSSLAILRRMNHFSSKRLEAKHSLMHSRALDKCCVDLINDSIIAPAVKFYSNRGKKKERLMMHFYLGRINFNAGNYEAAFISQMRARQIADELDDLYWKAMVASSLGFIFSETYDTVGELEAFQEAYDYWMEYGDSLHIDNAIFSLGTACHNNNQFKKADSLFAIICERGRYEALLFRADNEVKRPGSDVSKAIEYYKEAIAHNVSFGIDDYYQYALALSKSGDGKKAEELLETLSRYPASFVDLYAKCKILRNERKFEEALDALVESTVKFDAVVGVQLRQSVNKAWSNYIELMASNIAESKRHAQLILVAFIIISLLSIVLLSIQYHTRMVKLECENESVLIMYEETKKLLESASSQSSQQEKDKLLSLRASFAKLYQGQFHALSKALEAHKNSLEDSNLAQNVYLERVNSILSNIRSRDIKPRDFENLLDNELDGIMSKLRKDYPNLSERDFQTLSYLIVGFEV